MRKIQNQPKIRKQIFISIICLISIFLISIFTCNTSKADSTENYEEGTDVDRYTIEDIFFNRVPIFDVNVFSDTAGGQIVKSDSVLGILRTVIATWYVSFRNLVAILLAMLLVYSGIRIAISTIAADKAKYKEILIGWIKGIVILFTIHYMMIFILNFNSMFLNLLSKAQGEESTIYNTIRTRAYDLRFSVGIPATIMYLALVIFFIKFSWIYLKRTFTIMLLIVIAPFVAGKYALDSSNGKRSQALSKWLYEFSTNVLIQPIHAILYIVLMTIAIKLANTDIVGFVLALVFMNMILKSDELILSIFSFKSSSMQSIKKPFNKAEDLGGIFVTAQLTKSFAKGTINATKKVGHYALAEGKDIYNWGMDRIDSNNGKNNRKNIKDYIRHDLNGADTTIGEGLAKLTKKNENISNTIKDLTSLRIKSREGGEKGRNARKTIKRKVGLYGKSFTGTIKYATKEIGGIGNAIFGMPMMVVDPKLGAAMLIKGVKTIKENGSTSEKKKYTFKEHMANFATLGMYRNRKEAHEKSVKEHTKVDKTIKHIIAADSRIDSLEEEIDRLNDEDKKDALDTIETLTKYKTNKYAIQKYIEQSIRENDIGTIDETTINGIIEEALEYTGVIGNLPKAERNELVKKTRMSIENASARRNGTTSGNKYETENVAQIISDEMTSKATNNKFTNIINAVNEINNEDQMAIDESNEEDEKDRTIEKSGLTNWNKFIQNHKNKR